MTPIEINRNSLERFPLLGALCVVSIVFGSILACITPVFETVDDTCMKAIVSGVLISAKPSAVTAFSNLLIGWGLKSLYENYPGVPWYAVYQLTVHFISHVAMLWALLLIVPSRRTISVFCLYLVAMGVHLIVHLSFTTTAFLAIQSGTALLVAQLILNRGSTAAGLVRLVSGTCLMLIGSLIRFQMLKLMALLAIPFVIVLCIIYGSRRLYLQGGITAGLLLSISLGLAWFDQHDLVRTAGWESFPDLIIQIYRTSDLSRINVFDTHPNESQEILRSVGWSRTDFYIMKTWFLIDEETYSAEKLRSFADQWLPLDSSVKQSLIRLLAALLLVAKTQLCMSCLFVGFLFAPSREFRTAVWGHRFCWGLTWGVIILLAWTQKLPERVFLPMLAFAALMSLLLRLLPRTTTTVRVSKGTLASVLRWGCVSIAACFAIASISSDFTWQSRVSRQHQRLLVDMKWVQSQGNPVFLMFYPFPYECLLPMDDLSEFKKIRSIMSGLYLRTPHTNELLKSYKIADLPFTLATEPGCLVATDPSRIKLLERYLREHCSLSVNFKEVYRAKSGFTVFASVPLSK